MKHLLRALSWDGTALILLDQTKLPSEIVHIRCENYRQVAEAIKILAVRGAPAIGVAAAYAVVLAFREARKTIDDPCALEAAFYESCRCIEQARPTAVNLSWAVREMEKVCADSAAEREEKLLCRAKEIEASDIDTCRRIGENGAALFAGKDRLRILTHCNTGALATAGIGTAFGVILKLFQNDQVECVYADETRPLLQGARLTASELMEDGIPCCLISDNMAAAVMRDKRIDAVIVGADRIAANGDTARRYWRPIIIFRSILPRRFPHSIFPFRPEKKSSSRNGPPMRCGRSGIYIPRRKMCRSTIRHLMSFQLN